jgi:DNA-binding NarL/FixJ family response regulator
VKNLIIIKSSESQFKSLKKAFVNCPRPLETNLPVVLLYSDESIEEQLKLLEKIKREWPGLKLIFSGNLGAFEVVSLFRAGISDYLVSPASMQDIELAIHRISSEQIGVLFSPEKYALSKREFQVCKLLVKGLKSKEVAAHLEITPATIKVHKSRIMRKLKVSNLPDLVRMVAA